MKTLLHLSVLAVILLYACSPSNSDSEEDNISIDSSDAVPVTPPSSDIKDIEKKDLIITFRQNNGLAISFTRNHIDSSWSSISFGSWPYQMINLEEEIELHSYVKNLDFYWNYIERSGPINLTSLGLLSPHSYPDVARNQVKAFNEDEEWSKDQNNAIAKKETLMLSKTYDKAAEIMLKHDVYKPINDFIKEKGFSISGYDLEKVAEISEEEQISMGIENPVLVPSPLAIIINVEKTSN